MIFLFASIICSSFLLVIFKLLERNKVRTFPVIVFSYIFCGIIGLAMMDEMQTASYIIKQSWFPFSLLMGILFISVFYSVAISTQKNGISVTSVAFKISVVIPVAAAFFLYNDRANFFKVTGILLALVAIVLTSIKKEKSHTPAGKFAAVLPALVFIGSGIADAFINYVQMRFLKDEELNLFLTILFFMAALPGVFWMLLDAAKNKNFSSAKIILWGFLLGIPNFFSVYFIILALEYSGLESSSIWPLANIGIILFSTASAVMIFHERVNKFSALGIAVAVIAILFIALSSAQ